MEQHVPEGGTVALRVGSDSCQGSHMIMHLPRQHNVTEVLLHCFIGLATAGTALPQPASGGVSYQVGCSKPPTSHISWSTAAAGRLTVQTHILSCSELVHVHTTALHCAALPCTACHCALAPRYGTHTPRQLTKPCTLVHLRTSVRCTIQTRMFCADDSQAINLFLQWDNCLCKGKITCQHQELPAHFIALKATSAASTHC